MLSKDEWIRLLQNNIVDVDFVKKDGSFRTIRGTLKEGLIPSTKGTGKKIPGYLVVIYDLVNDSWRSFIIENVQNYDIVWK